MFADSDQIERLRSEGYKGDVREDVQEAGQRRQREVGSRAARGLTRNVATATHYLNVSDVEASLANAASSPNSAFTQLIKLPHKTWEGRECHAIKIANGSQFARPGIYFLGGIRGREWGSCDILINFVEQLCEGYRTHSAITLGGVTFSAAKIQKLVNEDLNRNYDFLWNYSMHFDPTAPVANSTDPCDHDVYIGPAPASEPETKNVVWMFDTFANIRYFIDVHSYSEDILYSWGDDQDQSHEPQMTFLNAAFDGRRGVPNDTAYKAFIPAADKAAIVKLAKQMRTAIRKVRGRDYTVMQAMSLYPTAGSSDDYSYSRHLADSAKQKVFGYTIEWGSPDNETPFHPPYAEMKQIIQEITAVLLQFCVHA